MKIHKLPLVAGIIGLVITLSSLYRWLIMWHDTSQALLGAGIGVTIMGFAYIYNLLKEFDDSIRKTNKRTDAVVDWFMNRQKEAVLETARGKDE